MMKILNFIKKILLFIVLFGAFTALIDYLRMNSGDVPIFNLKSYDEKTKIQTFRGLFYIGERKIKTSQSEPLVDSSEMEFKILVFDLKVPRQFKEPVLEYTVSTREIPECMNSSQLYFGSKTIKVYTYCLENIKIVEDSKEKDLMSYLKKDNSFMEDFISKLAYTGIYKDSSTLMFESLNDSFTNQGLRVYQCHKTNINDYYIGPKEMVFQKDFCTFKDDDLRFLFEVVDETPTEEVSDTEEEVKPEVIFEDENTIYQLETGKADYIFITTPENRGRAAKKIPLKTVIKNKYLTIDEMISKGLKVVKVDINQEVTNKENS